MVKNMDRSFFRFVTIHAFNRQTDGQADRQTDGWTAFSSLYRVYILCSAVKPYKIQILDSQSQQKIYAFQLA